jgi:hypothetical protein
LSTESLSSPFLHFDDDIYVYNERHVTTGLTAENWVWAWTKTHAANWHPLFLLAGQSNTGGRAAVKDITSDLACYAKPKLTALIHCSADGLHHPLTSSNAA